jgi:rhamnosyltransferase
VLAKIFKKWLLLIRDDGSPDPTSHLIDRYCKADTRISQIAHDGRENAGPKDNFRHLLKHGMQLPAQLFMFCDQDDYWHPEKLRKYVDRASNENVPCLIYSDIELVDANLAPLNAPYSFEPFPDAGNRSMLSSLLSLNHIPGCSIAINRALAEIAAPIPEAAIMHDWWAALAAAACGKLLFINEKLIQYRQHSGNAIGSRSLGQLTSNLKSWPNLWRKGSHELCSTILQAGELAKRLEHTEAQDPELMQILNSYAGISNESAFERLKTAKRLELRKGRGVLRLILNLRLLLLDFDTKNS